MFPERLRPLVDATAGLSDRFRDAGHTLYLVGGSVRDAIVATDGAPTGDATPDLDFTTDARPDDIEAVVRGWADAVWTQGKRFGTIACLRDGQKYEITTHRAEAYRPDSRKPEVAFGDDIEDDLSRRDFTVNAMALRLPDLELIDPFGGLVDLAERRLRTPLDPDVSFSDDPLRMLRAARFMAQARPRAHRRPGGRRRRRPPPPRRSCRPSGSATSSTRSWWCPSRRWPCGSSSAPAWPRTSCPSCPGLAVEQDPIHRHKDVLAHTLAVVDKTSPDRLLRLAALFHDVGKPRTRAFVDGGVTFHHHEVVGARMTRKRMQALRYPNDEVDTVTELVNLHLRFHTYRLGWTDRAVRRYVRDAGPLLDQLNELTRCDCTTRNAAKARALDRRMDELEARIATLREQEELDAIRPDLDGAQVMAHLGIPPGRAVGEALSFLLELRMDEGPLGEEEAFRRLDGWWAGRVPSG